MIEFLRNYRRELKAYKKLFELKDRFDGLRSNIEIDAKDVACAMDAASRLEPSLRKIVSSKYVSNYEIGRTVEIHRLMFGRHFLNEAIEVKAIAVGSYAHHLNTLRVELKFEKYKEIYQYFLDPTLYMFLDNHSPLPYQKAA